MVPCHINRSRWACRTTANIKIKLHALHDMQDASSGFRKILHLHANHNIFVLIKQARTTRQQLQCLVPCWCLDATSMAR
jgi:hypothetical protein